MKYICFSYVLHIHIIFWNYDRENDPIIVWKKK